MKKNVNLNNNPNWKGGKSRDNGGILIKFKQHPFSRKNGYIYQHRLIMEKYLRENYPNNESLININGQLYINSIYVVKHINKDVFDNNIRNLKIVTRSKHMSEENKGIPKQFTEEHINNIRLSIKEKDLSGDNNPMYGKTHTDKTKLKLSKVRKKYYKDNPDKIMVGNKNPMWKGGISNLPYPYEFNDELKIEIKTRDNYTCQECGLREDKSIHSLEIHHIDYNKDNCDNNNLISLCKSCHAKTNTNRKYWIKYYRSKING